MRAEVGTVIGGHGPDFVDVVGRNHPVARYGEVRCTSRRSDRRRIVRLRRELQWLGFEVALEPTEPPPERVRVTASTVRSPQVCACARCEGPAIIVPIPPRFETATCICPSCTFGGHAREAAR